MFYAGDEFLNSQFGNNNAYCQDNEISWLDWKDLKKNEEHFEFCKYMTAFRKAHPILRKFTGSSCIGYPEIQVMGVNDACKVLRVMFAGRGQAGEKEDIVCLAINVFWEEQEFYLPDLPNNMHWSVAADTGRMYLEKCIPADGKPIALMGNHFRMKDRSVCVLVAE